MARTFAPGDERATWGIKPRSCIDLQTPAEAAIRVAICEVEKVGAHPMLTGAVVLLGQALEKLGEYVDGDAAPEAPAADRPRLTDHDLLYAATARCRCGAGLAHPLDHDLAIELRAWVCSVVLKGDPVEIDLEDHDSSEDHDALEFAFFKVREETSVNNAGGYTTRPAGTVARTVGHAKCPICKHEWTSEPYSACAAGHHWFPGPCPCCGHAVGGSDSYSTKDGPPIETRHPHVILAAEATP